MLADSVSLALRSCSILSRGRAAAFGLTTCSSCPSPRSLRWSDGLGGGATASQQGKRRVKGAEIPAADADHARQRHVVDAFFRAARGGDFDTLVTLLHPDVVLRSDYGGRRPAAPKITQGAAAVASQALLGALPGAELHPALVNGAAGVVITVRGRPYAVMGFTVADGKIIEIDAIADPDRVGRIAAAVLSDE